MTRSMTAFGRASFSTQVGDFYLEIYSVNKKNLDISTFVSKDFFIVDLHLRKWIQKLTARGSVSIRLMRENKGEELPSALDSHRLKECKARLDGLAQELSMDPITSIEFLADFASRHSHKELSFDHERFVGDVEKGFAGASSAWIEMKESEGAHLAQDMEDRLDVIGQWLTEIEARAENAPQRYAQRLKSRLEEAAVFDQKDEEKVMKEVVIFSEKVDTTEELIRLRSHIKQLLETLQSGEYPIGRKLDFLIQEMNREINSLGVKCLDLEIVKRVLEIKAELEKVREQVQNIE